MKINEFIEELKRGHGTMYGLPVGRYEVAPLHASVQSEGEGRFNFCGVYVIYDERDEIVYIGESYRMRVCDKLRLEHHGDLAHGMLARRMARLQFGEEKEKLSKEQLEELRQKMHALKVLAIEFRDLGASLTLLARPIYHQSPLPKKK